MKKKLSVLLITGILAVLLIPFNIFATESDETESGCYIATTECPQEYMDFAEENVSTFVLSMGESLNYEDIIVGAPFAFADYNADVYYFPIICDGEVTYLFRVYPDGESFSAAISSFLAADIEELSALTSADSPLYLNLTDNKIIASVGTKEYVLFEYPEGAVAGNQAMPMSEIEYQAVDIKEASEIELNLMQARVFYQYINLDLLETQGDDEWCTAYCLASIIRLQTSYYVTARGCAIIAMGSNPSTSTAFPWTSISTVAKQYGMTPTVLTTTASNSVLMTQLNAGNPVITAMDSGNYKHAVLLRGYSTAGTWSIWNPWYNFYETYSTSGAYVPSGASASGNSFYPYMHAYNFE